MLSLAGLTGRQFFPQSARHIATFISPDLCCQARIDTRACADQRHVRSASEENPSLGLATGLDRQLVIRGYFHVRTSHCSHPFGEKETYWVTKGPIL